MLYNDLNKIKNAYLARHKNVKVPYSKVVLSIAKVLEERTYVGNVKITGEEPKKQIEIDLLYTENVPHLQEITFYSKPGARIYTKQSKLRIVRQGYGDIILSTPQGVMTATQARKRHIGGEVICEVF